EEASAASPPPPPVSGSGGGIGTGSGRGVGPGSGAGSGGGTYVVGNALGRVLGGIAGSSIAGRVTDTAGAVISGATVTARNEGTGASQSAATDSSGVYRFWGLPAGSYSLTIQSPGFQNYQISGVNFSGSGTVQQYARLN